MTQTPDPTLAARLAEMEANIEQTGAITIGLEMLDAYRSGQLITLADRDAAVAEIDARKDVAYLERNQLVALLAAVFPSGIKRTAIDGWSDDWHGCVYINFPWGQASWHYHDSQADLFSHLPPYAGEWDGHTTEAKYAAIVDASKDPAIAVQAAVAKAVEASVNAENEACAKMLDNEADDYEADASRFRGGTDPHHYRMDLATTARKYAAAIRSRGVAG